MKELQVKETVHLDSYDVHVKKHLTYGEIQAIVDAVKDFDQWEEREKSIDMLVLFYATDAGKEALEAAGHDLLLESGLIDEVKSWLVNYSEIHRALDYTQSTQRAVAQILKQLPSVAEPLMKVVEKYGKSMPK